MSVRHRCSAWWSLLPDRLDRAQRHLPLPHYGRDRTVRAVETRHRASPRRRLQLLLIAFAFGAFSRRIRLRNTGRDHRPVLIASVLAAGGFRPVTDRQYRPVAYGALGTRSRVWLRSPVSILYPRRDGRTQLPVFSLIVRSGWCGHRGWRGMTAIWPAISSPRVVRDSAVRISNYINPWIVDIGAS